MLFFVKGYFFRAFAKAQSAFGLAKGKAAFLFMFNNGDAVGAIRKEGDSRLFA
jgi:hypothetical protein